MEDVQEAARARILRAMKITGWKSTQLAREADIAPSTLNKFLNQEVKHTLSLRTLSKIDEAVRRHLNAQPFTPEKTRKELDYFRDASSALEPTDARMIALEVRGAVQAGYFAEAMEWPVEEWERISLPRPDSHRTYFGLRVRGPSMNRVYPEGTILVCVPFHDYNHALEPGDHVIVQRWVVDRVEATVKEIQTGPDGGYWLWPKSDHPEYQTPIAVPRNGHPDFEGSSNIRVVAVVVADYRVRTRKKAGI